MPDFIVPFVITVFKFHIQTRQGDCRLTTSLWAAPFNITMVQVYAPTSDYDDNKIEEFYDQLQNGIDQTPKKRTLFLCKETGTQKWERMLVETGKAFVDPSARIKQMREDSGF